LTPPRMMVEARAALGGSRRRVPASPSLLSLSAVRTPSAQLLHFWPSRRVVAFLGLLVSLSPKPL
jgi:hypothetical protein